jgi:hypothetical protein
MEQQSASQMLRSYSPDLAPSDFIFFGLCNNTREVADSVTIKVEMAVREWLRMQQPNFYRDGTFGAKMGQAHRSARGL